MSKIMAKISIDLIKEWVKENPNDYDLGNKVRTFINKIQIQDKKEKLKK